MERKRIRDFGLVPGRLQTGKRNKITDVPGVKVGHCTVKTEENHTGVTVILPGGDNAFAKKYIAAAYVHKGFGKSAGLVQIDHRPDATVRAGDAGDPHCPDEYVKCRKGMGRHGGYRGGTV